MAGDGISLKATTEGLVVVLKEQDDFETLLKKMEQKLLSGGDFFKGAVLKVRYRGRNLTEEEEKKLLQVMKKSSGARIESLAKEQELKTSKARSRGRDYQIKKHLYFTGIDEGNTKFSRGTLRSGQLLKFDGNVVVIGDVNPGAEIRATGNVIVTGTIKGVVHAGCDGNINAVISAYKLQPTQLRIAGLITRPPDEDAGNDLPGPEIAYVNDGKIYIEKYCHK